MELINLIRESYIAEMNFNIHPGVWNRMYDAYERQQAQHQYAIKNGCICQCLPCSGERLELQRKADYEKELKAYNEARFVTTNALWAW